MKIDVIISAKQVEREKIYGKLIIIIDVLRATSVICTAMCNGAKTIIPVSTVSKAISKSRMPYLKSVPESQTIEKKTNYYNSWAMLLHTEKTKLEDKEKKDKERDVILTGERNGFKIEGFDLGNSPLEFTKENVNDKTIILTTTNGTKAIKNCKPASEIIIASFLNVDKVSAYMQNWDEVCIVCAGTLGDYSLDDALCAGNIISNVCVQNKNIELSDQAFAHKTLYESLAKQDLKTILKDGCKHYTYLENNGFGADLDYCLKKNTCPVVPKMNGERISL